MDPIIYFLLFFIASLLSIVIKSSNKGEIEFNFAKNTTKEQLLVLKVLPTLIVIFFANEMINVSITSNLYLGIMVGLIFCLCGDIAIEYNLIQGMLLFGVAHIFFIITFLFAYTFHFFAFELISSLIMLTIIIMVGIYNYMFRKFLKSGNQIKNYLPLVTVYSALISTMFILACSLVYFMNLNFLIIAIPVGAFLFIVSDTLIGIREFHSKDIEYSVVKILGTYYLAIFFLSFSTAIL